jgi:predicted Zn-dependent peptidase
MHKITILLSLLFALSLNAQDKPTAPAIPESEQSKAVKPNLRFKGQIYTLDDVSSQNDIVTNHYFLPAQVPDKFSRRLSISVNKNAEDPAAAAKEAMARHIKDGADAELAPESPEGTTGIYVIQLLETGLHYDIYLYSSSPDGNDIIVKQIASRSSRTKKLAAMKIMKQTRAQLIDLLAKTTFPKMTAIAEPKKQGE